MTSPLSPDQISDAFTRWWAESFPNAHATAQTRNTFTAFAAFVLEQANDDDTPTAA